MEAIMHEIRLSGYGTNAKCLNFGTSGSYGIEKIKIEKADVWENASVSATFVRRSKSVKVHFITDTIDVPAESTADETKEHDIGVIVFEGIHDDGRVYSVGVKFTVSGHPSADGDNVTPPTPSELEQIWAAINSKGDVFKDRDNIFSERNDFDGEVNFHDDVNAPMPTKDSNVATKSYVDADNQRQDDKIHANEMDIERLDRESAKLHGANVFTGQNEFDKEVIFNEGAFFDNGIGVNGQITIEEEPTDDKHAATKKYVDEHTPEIHYPVTSVNGKTGNVSINADELGAVSFRSGELVVHNELPAIYNRKTLKSSGIATEEVQNLIDNAVVHDEDGVINAGNRITEVSEPEEPSDAATKGYVDAELDRESAKLKEDLSAIVIINEVERTPFLTPDHLYADGGVNIAYTADGIVATNPGGNHTVRFVGIYSGNGRINIEFTANASVEILVKNSTSQANIYSGYSNIGKNSIDVNVSDSYEMFAFVFDVPYLVPELILSGVTFSRSGEEASAEIKESALPPRVVSAASAFVPESSYRQMIDYESVHKYKSIDYAYGITTASDYIDSDYLFSTDTIAVTSGDVLAFNIRPQFITGYRSTKVAHGQYAGSALAVGSSGGYEFTVPSNVAYIIVTFTSGNDKLILLEKANVYTESDDPIKYGVIHAHIRDEYIPSTKNEIPSEYDGDEIRVFKHGLCIGDSLTKGVFNTSTTDAYSDESRSYPAILSRMMGISITNTGIGGTTSSGWYQEYKDTDLSSHDFAIIQLGVNDSITQPNGWDSTSDAAMRNIIEKLKNENRGIKIFVATIIPATQYNQYKQFKASERIRSLVDSIADDDVILMDIAKYGHGLQSDAYSAYHLTAIGYQRLAKDYYSMISAYIGAHLAEFKWVQFIGTDKSWHG